MFKVGDLAIEAYNDGHRECPNTVLTVVEVRTNNDGQRIRFKEIPYWWQSFKFVKVNDRVMYKNKDKKLCLK